MSAIANAWAWQKTGVKQNQKLLLLFLADNADRFGRGSHLEKLLADAQAVCGIETPRVVKEHFEGLVASGLIERDGENYRLAVTEKPIRSGFYLPDHTE